ncbi:MAG: hypothetical protein AVDCRST_MAG69-2009, partial [uncultured Solirubrobacteraceae bacterium]
ERFDGDPASSRRGGGGALAAVAQRGHPGPRSAAAGHRGAGGLPAGDDRPVRPADRARGLSHRVLPGLDRSPVVPAGRRIRRCRHRVEPRARHRAGLVRPAARLARPAPDAADGTGARRGHPVAGPHHGGPRRRAAARRRAHRRAARPARAVRGVDRLLRRGRAVGHLHGAHLPHPAGRAAHAAGRVPRRVPVDRLHARGPAARLAGRRGVLEPGHPRPRARAPGDGVGHPTRSRAHGAGPAGPRRAHRGAGSARAPRSAAHGPL